MKIDLGKVLLHGWQSRCDMGRYPSTSLDLTIEPGALKSSMSRSLTFQLSPAGSEQEAIENALLGRIGARLILELADPCTRCGSIDHDGDCTASDDVKLAYQRGLVDGRAREKKASR